jgi:hypothetical protein
MKRLLPEGSAATVAGALASSLRARRLTSRSREKAVLRLSDENLETLRTAAAPIDPRLRPRFLQAVAAAMRDPDPGPGEFHRIAHDCARKVMNGL